MDQKPELQVRRMTAGITLGTAMGGIIGLVIMDRLWGFPIGILIVIAIGSVWDLLR